MQEIKNMKSGFLTINLIIVLLMGILIFISCKKEKPDSNTSIAVDYFTAENESNRVIDAMNSLASGIKLSGNEWFPGDTSRVLFANDTVFIDTVSTVRTMAILFDTTNGCLCTGWDNRTRKGNIIATWTGKYHDVGTVITITTQHYYVDAVRYDYTETITNKGLNSSGNLVYAINVLSALITFSDSTKINWTSTRNRELTSGSNTSTLLDDTYSITGTSQGSDRAGTPFTATITSPLIVKVGCAWVEKGVLNITPEEQAIRSLDFGDGTCDSQATVTINGTPYNIGL